MTLPFLASLSSLVHQRLNADDYFADIPVFEQARGVIAEEVTQALAAQTTKGGKAGAAVIVNYPFFETNESQTPQGDLRTIVVIDIHVDPLVNFNSAIGTGKTIDEIWMQCAVLLSSWRSATLDRTLNLDSKPMSAANYETGEQQMMLRLFCNWGLDPLNRVTIGGLTVEHVTGTSYRARVTAGTTGAQVCIKATDADEIPVVPSLANTLPVDVNEWFTFTATVEKNVLAVGYIDGMRASNELSALLTVNAVPLVTNLTSPGATDTSLDLVWECDTADVLFEVQCVLADEPTWALPIGGTIEALTPDLTLAGLAADTAYKVRVRPDGGEWVLLNPVLTSFAEAPIEMISEWTGASRIWRVTGPAYDITNGSTLEVKVNGSVVSTDLPAQVGEVEAGQPDQDIELTVIYRNDQRTLELTQTVTLTA